MNPGIEMCKLGSDSRIFFYGNFSLGRNLVLYSIKCHPIQTDALRDMPKYVVLKMTVCSF